METKKHKNKFSLWYSKVVQEQKKGLYDFNQKIYITILSFISNDLLTIASAGTYNFLMSAVPLFSLTIVILIRVLNQSMEEVKTFLGLVPSFSTVFNIDRFFIIVLQINSFSFFEIFLIIFMFWMGRRFFASLQHGIRKVYRKKLKIEPLKVSLIVILGEIILVNVLVFFFIFLNAGNLLFTTELGQKIVSQNIFLLLKNIFKFTPFVFMNFLVFCVYYFMPPIKPTKKNAYFSSFVCTLSYFTLKIFFGLFRNTTRFTIVYGFFSEIILLLLQVWFFFFFFTFFAQFMYVTQFFKSFVISQLYRMPKYNEAGFLPQLERTLFIEPPQEYRKKAVNIKAGECIFKFDDESSDIYYIIKGSVKILLPNKIIDLGKGNSFGEFACLLDGKRVETAIAKSDCTLAKVSKEEFLETLSIDGDVSRQALKILSDYLMDS